MNEAWKEDIYLLLVVKEEVAHAGDQGETSGIVHLAEDKNGEAEPQGLYWGV